MANFNPRPWEWSWWTQADHLQKTAAEKIVPPFAPGHAPAAASDADDSAAVQRIIEHLPPEDRAGFMRNLKRWAQLTTAERQTLRRQADERRQRIEQETQKALHESGLQLDEDHREVFMLRYGQERRKLERELQEKLSAERARRTSEIIERLKHEFESAPPTPAPSAAATGPMVTAAPTL